MGPLRWGILSAGLISHDLSVALGALPKSEHCIVAVAARDLDKAKAFAKTHEIPKAYGSYQELVKDSEIDIVYVGSINTQHLPLVKLALNEGKHILCEKPLGMNVKETREMLELAKEKKVFFMEGIWSRFFPVYKELRKRLDNNALGDVLQVIVTFGEKLTDVDRLVYKELGGGTTLDIGVYCVQFAEFVFREKPIKVISGGHLNFDGVDESAHTTLIFPGGKTATLITHSKVDLPNEGLVIGTKGALKVCAPFICPTELEEVSGKKYVFPLPQAKTKVNFENGVGMMYECQEVRDCILNGRLESSVVSHEHTLLIAEILESIRKQIGVTYPQDSV